MCGVIFGEWRGEDPADRDMPTIRDKFKKEHAEIHWLQSYKRGRQHPEKSAFGSSVEHMSLYTRGNSHIC